MHARTAVVAALATLGSVVTALPAHAAPPPPVESISISSRVHVPAHLSDGFSISAVVSWSGEDSTADGVVVCLVRGRSPSNDPAACDNRADVAAPNTHTARIGLRERTSYAVSVFAYTNAADPEYSTPVTAVRDGSALDGKRLYQVTYGHRVTLRTTLSDRGTGDPLPNEPLTLIVSRPGSDTWDKVDTFTTDTDGRAWTRFRPRESGVYLWRYNGGDSHLAAFREDNLLVGDRVTAHLTQTYAAPGESVRLYGIVRPAAEHVRVELSEYLAAPCDAYVLTGQKVTAKRQRLPSGRTTFGYVMTISRSSVGKHKFEAYAGGGSSPSVTLTVGAGQAYRTMARSVPALPAC